jgi:Cu(I)/Ag(I) efflux system periplasmic protein CusF
MQTIARIILALTLWIGAQAGLAQSSLIAGQVVKVDQSAKKITIMHGPAPKLDMNESMTMVYAVSDPNFLKTVTAGDKVNFDAERVNGQLTVTKIGKAK